MNEKYVIVMYGEGGELDRTDAVVENDLNKAFIQMIKTVTLAVGDKFVIEKE